ncbi:MAG TPA: PAS domain S-box protein [Armatimonadota bacterium]|nr:PAS domain S-box protein [Armatimonadota bacterium]
MRCGRWNAPGRSSGSSFFFRHRLANGEVRDVEVYNGPIEVAGKQLLYSIIHDVTERKRAENALRAAKERLLMLFNASPLAIIAVDLNARVVEWNPAAARIFGLSEADALGKTVFGGLETWSIPRQEAWMRLLAGHTTREEFEVEWMRGDGQRVTVAVSVVALHDGEGRVSGIECVVNNVTRRKIAEATRARMSALIEAIPYLVATADIRGKVLTLNGAGRKLLGVAGDEDLSRLRLLDLYPDSVRSFIAAEALPAAIRDGLWAGDTLLRKKGGEEIPVSQILLAHKAADGKLEYLSAISSDMSERVHMEEELRQAQKMEAVGRLAGGVAHDFNNLLQPLLTYGDLLRSKLPPEHPLYECAQQVAMIAERATALPRQLLAFSRKQIIQPKVLDLNTVITDLGKMLRRLIGEDIILEHKLAPDAGCILADPGQVEQVLMNLAVNARDAMPRGGTLRIETAACEWSEADARLHPGMKAGRYVRMTVSDTGCGMDRETQTHIFEPFYTTKEEGQGTGLGLSTVYGIVTQNGGLIRVSSELDCGTTFTLYLPRVEAEPEREVRAPEAPAAGGKETILLVEDEEVVRSTVKDILSLSGYQVLSAGNSTDAFRLCAECRGNIHLLLTDVVMPGLSGREIAERLTPLRPEMRVLFMSGYTESDVLHHGVLDDSAFFIQKPFRASALVAKVREVLASD